ncbi:cation:proton antiporter [Gordonia sp. VNK21]|uniref:cation:proton antiporter n=1 Tax=Gordonia sp. VNK21 TaxID=3382483 RepID=UPI0038D372E9
MDASNSTLLLVPLLILAAPILARLIGRWVRIPVMVFELLLGIVFGPAVLGLVHDSAFLETMADLGVALLFFMAGSEIQLSSLQGRTGRRAWGGWLLSLALGLAVGLIVAPGLDTVIIGIALCSTALGTLLPVLRDAGVLDRPFGHSVSAVGAVGEFGPIVAISLVLSGRSPGAALVVLLVFFVIAALLIWRSNLLPHGRLHRFVESTLHTSGQFAVRLVMAIMFALIVLSLELGIDMLLGAFAAGVLWQALIRDAAPPTRHAVESKLEGLAFGFLVPVFFVSTGVQFDLRALLDAPLTLLLVPVVTLTLLVVRGLPSMLAAPAGASRSERAAVGLLGATGLPIIVVVTTAGVQQELISSTAAAVLVGGGMLSVLLFPLIGMALVGRSTDDEVPAGVGA